MITIDQLLESVDLDFEPRWVTKDNNGEIWIWNYKPVKDCNWHIQRNVPREFCGFFITNKIKLSDFENKDWQECIYEVPRKEELKDKIKIGTLYIDKSVTFGDGDDDDVGVVLEDYEVPRKTTGDIKKIEIMPRGEHATVLSSFDIALKVNEIIDKIETLEERTEDVCARIIEVERKVL